LRLTELRVDGGATVNNLLMQFQADLLGVPVVRAQISETTALGAAYLAGLAVGFWRDRAEIGQLWQRAQTFAPNMSRGEALQRRQLWSRALESAKGWETP
jgi:glycerol kinase